MSEDSSIQQLSPDLRSFVSVLRLPLADQPVHKFPPDKRLLVCGEVVLAILDQARSIPSCSGRREGGGRVMGWVYKERAGKA